MWIHREFQRTEWWRGTATEGNQAEHVKLTLPVKSPWEQGLQPGYFMTTSTRWQSGDTGVRLSPGWPSPEPSLGWVLDWHVIRYNPGGIYGNSPLGEGMRGWTVFISSGWDIYSISLSDSVCFIWPFLGNINDQETYGHKRDATQVSSEIPGKVGTMVFQAEQFLGILCWIRISKEILCKNKTKTEVMI